MNIIADMVNACTSKMPTHGRKKKRNRWATTDYEGNGEATRFHNIFPLQFFCERKLKKDIEVTIVDSSGNRTKPTYGTGANNFRVTIGDARGALYVDEVVYPADEVTPLPPGSRIIINLIHPQ